MVLLTQPLAAQSIPPERPRARPPSELTGWADWEKGEALLQRIKIPPAPPLSPAEAMKTFRLAPGYRLELVAAEPMIQNPIFFEFDADGRIWVIEYQGYMRDLQGRGEGDPICRVVVLEDHDEDGTADKSTAFLDKLVMPRSLAFVKGGVLIAEPPHLWFCQDKDGDLRCDSKVLVGSYGRAGNPQHTANGLRYGLDNWLHSADWPKRHRFVDGTLIEEPTIHRGQFGVTFDDGGRFLTCYESSALHADLLPAEYLLRNTNYFKAYQRGGGDRSQFGVNVNIARHAQEIFPIRVTPAITLGALELREDGRLCTYTIVSGVCFYDGHHFPDDAYGNVFVPEAGGHLIGRLRLTGDIELKAARFYASEQEFLTSTDERFRPVNARVGPDGALYIADLYRGVIEHVIFMVPWLERQIKDRDLETGLDLGRLYRVVYEGEPIERKRPRLASSSSRELVECLNHPNGWWRVTAQRLLVERRDTNIIPTLRALALNGTNPRGRPHALWTLDGMGSLDWNTAVAALRDKAEIVRATAIRLCERTMNSSRNNRGKEALSLNGNEAASAQQFGASPSGRSGSGTLKRGHPTAATESELFRKLLHLAEDASSMVRLQTLLTLGSLKNDRAEKLMLKLLEENPHYLFRAAAMTGLQGRELEFLVRFLEARPRAPSTSSERDLKSDSTTPDHAWPMIVMLAQAVLDEADPERIGRLLALLDPQNAPAAGHRSSALARHLEAPAPPERRQGKGEWEARLHWTREAIVEGMLAAAPRDMRNVRPIQLTRTPSAITKLTRSDDESVRQRAVRLLSFFSWPSASPLRTNAENIQPLSPEQQRLADLGKEQFAIACAACHQPHGLGLPNVAPPLSGSDWVTGPPERLVRVVLHGLYGPIEVNGQSWNLHMPGFGSVFNDEQIAAILTYIRQSWGNAAEPVELGPVTQARQSTNARALAWTASELVESVAVAASEPTKRPNQHPPIRPDAKGELHLTARLATTYGRELAYRPSLDILAPWRREQDVAEWRVEVTKGEAYEVWITLAADDASAGDKFVIETEGSRTAGVVQTSGGYDRFKEYACGTVSLVTGLNRLIMRPEGPLRRELADVRALRLVPAK